MRLAILFVAVTFLALVGCNREEPISQYTISVPDVPLNDDALAGALGHSRMADASPSRMIAAIVPKGSQTWFFKVKGSDDAVAKQTARIVGLIKSVRFAGDGAPPTWDLPEGWTQRGASGMRLATIEIKEDSAEMLELTVIPLATQGELGEFVLANVNRWRGELGLLPLAAMQPQGDDESAEGVTQFQLSDSTMVTLVNMVGRGGASHVTAGTGFDMDNHPPIDGAMREDTAGGPPADSDSITYTTPEGWTVKPASGMRHAAFEVSDGDKKVEITVISLPLSGGERLANVNRWRDQIGLGPITAEQLAEDLEEISLDKETGDYVELNGPKNADKRQTILAVLVDVSDKTWFFKLMGDADLAARERERFRSLIQSLKFSPSQTGAAGG